MTTDPHDIELMHAEIDGVISAEDRKLLFGLLEADPSAKRQFEALRSLSGALSAMEEVVPPADLKIDILAAVRARKASGPVGVSRWLPAWPGGRALLGYGYAVAGGLVLGLLIFRWVAGPGGGAGLPDPSELVGTMTRHEPPTPSGSVQRISLDLPGGSATATVRRSEGGYMIEFDLDSRDSVDVTLGFDSGAVAIRGLAQDPEAIRGLLVQDGRIAWSQREKGRLALLMTPLVKAGSAIDLEFFVTGNPVKRGKIALPGQGES